MTTGIDEDVPYALHGPLHDIDAADSVCVVPMYGTILWSPTTRPIPTRFHRADGTGGTQNLVAVEPAGCYWITRVV